MDSQESSIFGGSDSSKAEDNLEDDTEGVFIKNMGAVSLTPSNNPPPPDSHGNSGDATPDDAEQGQDGLIHSPGKVIGWPPLAPVSLLASQAVIAGRSKR